MATRIAKPGRIRRCTPPVVAQPPFRGSVPGSAVRISGWVVIAISGTHLSLRDVTAPAGRLNIEK
ncbi:hypothetical protein GCM10011576_42980 [Micromonospora parathelypteridis]|nr:hypothetical protein GCM10011576_42980 [Micromonospora parathelypteridis]